MTSGSTPPITRKKGRILSGIQPTGNLHLGNYLGAIRNWASMQSDYQCLFCIVDMHAVTVWQEPSELGRATREVAAGYIAAGLDPSVNTLFVQSHVPAHAQLAWVFNCVSRLGWLNRMTQFKDKAGKNREAASSGLYVYPNLMAADILVYKATHVPVGEDQKQHLELARDIAQKFNTDYGTQLFPLPKPVIQGPGMRVMSLRDGKKKMSKSDPSVYSRINMTDSEDEIAHKIRKATTDAQPLPGTVVGLKGRPEASNLLNIYAALTDRTLDQALAETEGWQFSQFKTKLTEVAVGVLGPITAEMKRLIADPTEIDQVLRRGADSANEIANVVLQEAYNAVGFMSGGR